MDNQKGNRNPTCKTEYIIVIIFSKLEIIVIVIDYSLV